MSIYLSGTSVLLHNDLISIDASCCCTGTGACCNGSTCSIKTESDCRLGGGVYLGNGTTCTPNPCTGCVYCDGLSTMSLNGTITGCTCDGATRTFPNETWTVVPSSPGLHQFSIVGAPNCQIIAGSRNQNCATEVQPFIRVGLWVSDFCDGRNVDCSGSAAFNFLAVTFSSFCTKMRFTGVASNCIGTSDSASSALFDIGSMSLTLPGAIHSGIQFTWNFTIS